jgi:hypothetical protein
VNSAEPRLHKALDWARWVLSGFCFIAMSYNPKVNVCISVALVGRGLALCVSGPLHRGELLRWQTNGFVMRCLGLPC